MSKLVYMKRNSISVKQLISEFGERFSEHMKEKLMELDSRSFLTRKDFYNRFDLKHVEHIKHECDNNHEDDSSVKLKEYTYGQFQVNDNILYFSESCAENREVTQSPIVSIIYDSLESENTILDDGRNLKKVDDNNIDFIIDSILSECPPVSQAYLDIVKGIESRAHSKAENNKK